MVVIKTAERREKDVDISTLLENQYTFFKDVRSWKIEILVEIRYIGSHDAPFGSFNYSDSLLPFPPLRGQNVVFWVGSLMF